MNGWSLVYTGYEPGKEGLRETLCALGNGYIVSRACAPDALADDVHYPGTYLAGGYNRLVSTVDGHEIVYLASDEAKFVTGSELVIDGGYTAR